MPSPKQDSATFLRGEPGVYRSVSDSVYHAFPAISNSGLGKIRRSPAHYKYGEGKEATDALIFGRAFHSAIGTPADFEKDFVTWEGDRRTTAGKEAYAKLVEKHGENLIKTADLTAILAMRGALMENPVAKSLMDMAGEPELSILWDCEGVLAKSRIDKYVAKDGLLVDWKTTRNAHPEAFAKSVYQYGYHRQAAFYLWAARAMGLKADRFLFVAIEKEPPYGNGVYELSDAALRSGLAEVIDLIGVYKTCLETNTWPSYGTDIITLDLPAWAAEESLDDQP